MTALLEDVLVDDKIVWPILTALTSCLCAEVDKAGLEVCICTPMPGDAIATDYVTPEAGMAWTRLASVFPSSALPGQDPRARCASPIAFTVEVGTAFCSPLPGPDGEPPDMVANFEATRVQLAGMSAALRAIRCCLGAATGEAVLGQYLPIGPQGGVVGGYWTVAIAQGAVVTVDG